MRMPIIRTLTALAILAAAPAQAASLNSVGLAEILGNVDEVEMGEGEVAMPIGTIIPWLGSGMPDDEDGVWLECDGSAIPDSMPVLRALLPDAKTPDLRGKFLRGIGGAAGLLAQFQEAKEPDHDHGVNLKRQTVLVSVGGTAAPEIDRGVSKGTTTFEVFDIGGATTSHAVGQSVPAQTGTTELATTDTILNRRALPERLTVRYLIKGNHHEHR